jgi:hypothetical protein
MPTILPNEAGPATRWLPDLSCAFQNTHEVFQQSLDCGLRKCRHAMMHSIRRRMPTFWLSSLK